MTVFGARAVATSFLLVACGGRTELVTDDGGLPTHYVGASLSAGEESLPVPISGISNAVDIVAGSYHTCALLDDESVRCRGPNDVGQLGNGTTAASSVPVTVTNLPE